MAVMFADLDRFKRINDSLGHAVGDALLVEVSRRIETAVREYDTVARLGGDEFAVLLEGLDDEVTLTQVAERIMQALGVPIHLSDGDAVVTTSLGIAPYPEAGDTIDELLKSADAAVYEAKRKGRNNFQIFNRPNSGKARSRLQLESALRTAVEKQQFVLFYQPQHDAITREVVALEALLRWKNPVARWSPLLSSSLFWKTRG